MKKINHITWSFALSLWIYYYLFNQNILQTIFFSFFVGILAWLPDVDLRIIKLSQKLVLNSFFIFYPFHLLIKIIFKHRTITHTIWIPLSLFLINKYINVKSNFIFENIIMILIIAILLHIFEDSLTISGVQPLFPIPIKIRLWNFNTSSQIHFFILEVIGYLIIFGFIVMMFS